MQCAQQEDCKITGVQRMTIPPLFPPLWHEVYVGRIETETTDTNYSGNTEFLVPGPCSPGKSTEQKIKEAKCWLTVARAAGKDQASTQISEELRCWTSERRTPLSE